MAQSVTIPMEDDLFRWLSIAAASRDVPVEALVREVLREARARSVNSAVPEATRRFSVWLSRLLLFGGITLLVIGLVLAVVTLVFLR